VRVRTELTLLATVAAAVVAFAATVMDVQIETHAPTFLLGWAVVVRIAALAGACAAMAGAGMAALAPHVGRAGFGLALAIGLAGPRRAAKAPVLADLRARLLARTSAELAQRIAREAAALQRDRIAPAQLANWLTSVIETSSWLGAQVQAHRLAEVERVHRSAPGQLCGLVRLASEWHLPIPCALGYAGRARRNQVHKRW
jgi:hypothetical protein